MDKRPKARTQPGIVINHKWLLEVLWTDRSGYPRIHRTFNSREASQLLQRLRADGLDARCQERCPIDTHRPNANAANAIRAMATRPAATGVGSSGQ